MYRIYHSTYTAQSNIEIERSHIALLFNARFIAFSGSSRFSVVFLKTANNHVCRTWRIGLPLVEPTTQSIHVIQVL
jgi:hypothetical protein